MEKILKSIIIDNGKEVLRIHNLVRLAETAGVYHLMSNEHQDFLANLTPFAIEARYGDYKRKLSEIIDRRTASIYFDKAKGVFGWLRKKIKK